jgi:predicted HicB family RNase H-like nuclease
VKTKNKQIVTSLRVDSKLWKEAKIAAIRQGISLTEVVDNALRKELNLHQNPMEDKE